VNVDLLDEQAEEIFRLFAALVGEDVVELAGEAGEGGRTVNATSSTAKTTARMRATVVRRSSPAHPARQVSAGAAGSRASRG
jgi:hypothetical protein